MFLRATKRKKDGKIHHYWSVVENVRVGRRVFQRRALYLGELNLEKAVAVTRTPRAEPISHAETRRRGEFESYAGCFMKISLHPIGEGHPF